MLKGICYSPAPPEAYARTVMGRLMGHGLWVTTVAQWNLAWLSFPELDAYLDSSNTLKCIVDSFSAEHFGCVVGCADERASAAFPGLVSLLNSPPKEFLRGMSNGPWERLPIYDMRGGEAWVTLVQKRALLAESRSHGNPVFTAEQETDAASQAYAAIQKASGSVIYAKFGKSTPP